MAERRPPGFNVDLGFYDSDEVLSIPRKIRAAAIGVWTLAGSFSANKLSDGYVSAEALRDRGCTPAIRAALMATTKADGTPSPLWDDAGLGAIQFTRWPKWQRTSAEVKAYRDADAERKRKARNAGKQPATSEDSEMSDRTPSGPSQAVRSDSGTPKTETETETNNNGHQSSKPDLSSEPPRPRSRTFTEMAGGTERPPPPDPGPHALAARTIVKRVVSDAYPHDIRGKLTNHAARLLDDGTDTELVEAAVRLWLTKAHLGPAALSSCVAEVIKTRTNGHAPMGRASTKSQGILDVGARLAARFDQPDQPEIEARP